MKSELETPGLNDEFSPQEMYCSAMIEGFDLCKEGMQHIHNAANDFWNRFSGTRRYERVVNDHVIGVADVDDSGRRHASTSYL